MMGRTKGLAAIGVCALLLGCASAAPGSTISSELSSSSRAIACPRAEKLAVASSQPSAPPLSVEPSNPSALVAAPPPPPSLLFRDREHVSYAEVIDRMRAIADQFSETVSVVQSYEALLRDFGLDSDELPLESYSRIRLAFEATRDGGLWGLRWKITDELPRSDRIWEQWQPFDFALNAGSTPKTKQDAVTALAECDELSALFAIVARDLGVHGFVALHWPYWNHVVAVWQVQRRDGGHVRIVIPTTQSFLSENAGLGTRELETLRVLFPYVRRDVRPEPQLPVGLARFLIERLMTLGALSEGELQARRNRLGGS